MSDSEPRSAPERTKTLAWLMSLRPKQWLKNLLVFAAPLAAGTLLDQQVLFVTAIAFVSFCLMSSAVYLVNDIRDRDIDRIHPTKANRPIAAGQVPVAGALVLALLLAVASLVIAAWVSLPLFGILALYAILTLAYSMGLKNEPVLELALVSFGFLLRAIAGGVATGLPISEWFLIVTGFGALFLIAGKRFAELARTEEAGASSVGRRRSIDGYSRGFLRFVWAVSASVSITAYCLWAFDVANTPTTFAWAQWSVVPFVLALLRYAVSVDRGRAEAPEDTLTRDGVLVITGAVWLVLFGLGALGV